VKRHRKYRIRLAFEPAAGPESVHARINIHPRNWLSTLPKPQGSLCTGTAVQPILGMDTISRTTHSEQLTSDLSVVVSGIRGPRTGARTPRRIQFDLPRPIDRDSLASGSSSAGRHY